MHACMPSDGMKTMQDENVSTTTTVNMVVQSTCGQEMARFWKKQRLSTVSAIALRTYHLEKTDQSESCRREKSISVLGGQLLL